jgi:hypothetical protein
MRVKIAALFVILVVCVSTMASDGCDLCQKKLHNRYYVFRSGSTEMIICPECHHSVDQCYACGLPVAGTQKSDQDVICRTCENSAERCDACGNVLTRVYFKNSRGKLFCSNCNDSANRCLLCDSILVPGEWSYDSGRMICQNCLNNRPRCAGCNDFISGSYSTFKGFDGQFCTSCVEETPSCTSCLRPTGNRPVRLRNGNSLCRECAASAVRDSTELEKIIHEVSRYMERNLLMSIETHVKFELVDDIGRSIRSDHYRESGRFVRRGDDFTIKILRGLSRPISIETVAHELAHAWQAENGPHLTGDELIEGFAQWVAEKVLIGMGYSQLVVRLHYRDDVYGRGYKRLKDMEQRLGFAGVFREIKRLGQSP